ncbi:lysozyme inhibitor LprI family protein [Methylobacterium sp. OAE515]|uniref:lysozyme inhibitor LprI family protein n=1 Tax=Methylobacterium sp. OAE515 TaxID=2817895 RepID=UPI00178BAFE0
MKPYQERTATYVGRCEGDLSHVGKSDCLYDQTKALRIRVKAELKKRLADAEATVAYGSIGGMSGAERANAEKRAVLKGQATWEAYTKAVCDEAAAQVERNGGNGGDLEAGNCMIRHLVNRYNELRR